VEPEGDSKGIYSTLGWKLDSDQWDCDIPWDECEKAIMLCMIFLM